MGFKCGILGLPNVGKSTLFNALTAAGIAAENYPFCTIEPNVGIVTVPDDRLGQLAAIVNPTKVIPSVIEFVDIAGLVAGASRGEGLGNQFLANVRETDAIAHVVRCFEDDDIVHVAGKIDPVHDIEVINIELALADLETSSRALQRASKLSKGGDKEMLARKGLLERVVAHLDLNLPVRALAVASHEAPLLRDLHLLTAKPVLYVANVAENGFLANPLLAAVAALAAAESAQVVAVSAAIEAEIARLTDAEKSEFLAELGLEEAGLARVIRAGYRLLGLQTFLTAGPQEVRAWTIPVGTRAPQAAARIHTDFERGFIKAEVIAFDDYIRFKGEAGARDAGKLRQEGKDYIVQDGDVVHFRFNL